MAWERHRQERQDKFYDFHLTNLQNAKHGGVTMITTRREFVLLAGTSGLGALLAGCGCAVRAADRRLIDRVRQACSRLAPLGWRTMLADVTGGQLDITATDLAAELAKPLSSIDRTFPGFGDFALKGSRPIEPGEPDLSLLYHAFAAPSVIARDRSDKKLDGFPTLAEIEAVEDYVYGSRRSSLADIRSRVGGSNAPLGIVTFALHYRNAPDSVGGKHAQLCFSRTGIARLGDREALYDAEKRYYSSLKPDEPYAFRVVPRRFAAFLAVRVKPGDGRFGPQDALLDDPSRYFWVPIHKLFDGPECLSGMDLKLEMRSGLQNEELAAFHRFLQFQGYRNNYYGAVLEEYPFTIRNERIALLSSQPEDGGGLLVPTAGPLIQEAFYKNKRLTWPVDHEYVSRPTNLNVSSPLVLPGGTTSSTPGYGADADQQLRRPAPEYINARHRILPDKKAGEDVENLNNRSDLMQVLALGDFDAQHYIDSAGDGWVMTACKELNDAGVAETVPAFCMVGLPDFLPNLTQRDLMNWSDKVPKKLRSALWAAKPLALSQTRIAANVEMAAPPDGVFPKVEFDIEDDTVAAIVAQLGSNGAEQGQKTNGAEVTSKVGLPDGSPGLFDPGWDASFGTRYGGASHSLRRYLVGYGLGSPFIEDAKLCAALGSYWPGVAPDATRQYQPNKILSGSSYPWPSIAPLTDEEIGITKTPDGKMMSWDGVPGPQRRDKNTVAYVDETYVDYIDLIKQENGKTVGNMTAALTAKITAAEYKARILALAAVYWALGIREKEKEGGEETSTATLLLEKSKWAVLSFRPVLENEAGLAEAKQATGRELTDQFKYFIHIYRWGDHRPDDHRPDPDRFKTILVDIVEEVVAYSDGANVLLKKGDGRWTFESTPT
jgi:hypothetical protein